MTEKRECSATVFGPRVHSWQCTRRGTVERHGKWFCGQHDPVAKAKRDAARDDKWKVKRETETAIYAEGRRIAKLLHIDADVQWVSSSRFFDSGPHRALVISFEDCLKLVEKLAKAKRAVTPAASEAQEIVSSSTD